MSVQLATLLVAVIAGVASVAAALISLRGQRVNGLAVAEHAARQRERELLDKYQEPLVRAAYDLQSRLFNILARGLLTAPDSERQYVERSTAWLLGQYFGWVEILRREAQFLNLPSDDDRAHVQRVLGQVARACSSGSLGGSTLRIQRSEQRALGEVMVVRGRDAEGRVRSDCLGFAAFWQALDEPGSQISHWYSQLLPQVWALKRYPDARLRHLQHALVDLIDKLDPAHVRFPPEHRGKVPG